MSEKTATEAEVEEAEPEIDLRELIGKTVDEQTAAAEEAVEAGEEVEEAPEGDGEAEEVEAAEDASEDDDTAEEGSEDDGEGDLEPLEAPEHWSQADRDIYADLPREQQEWWIDRAKDLANRHSQRLQEVSDIQREHAAVTEALKPVDQMLVQAGMDRPTAVRRLVGAQVQLMSDPSSALAMLAGQYGRANPQEVVAKVAQALGVSVQGQSGQGEPAEDYLDPALAAQMNQLDQRFQQLESTITTQQQQAAASVQQQAQSELDQFREAKDEKGNLKHPHFDKVRTAMGALIGNGVTGDLADAYDRACGADPEIREALFKSRFEQTAKEREAGRKKDLKKAKAASRNISGSKAPGTAKPAEPKSHRAEIERQLEALEQAAG